MADRDLVRKDRQSSPASSPRGTNYLLAIAINDYQHCSKLNNAVRDVEVFIDVMTTRYQLEPRHVTFIKDTEATKKRIESAFDDLIDIIEPQDNLIVYFSGHGRHHERRGGFWVPVEAGKGDKDWPNYLSNVLIKDYLSKIKSFHTFLIADSCFSGSFFLDKNKERSVGERRDTDPSRWGLTSGKQEMVSDGEPGHHSPFASALLSVLLKVDKPIGVVNLCDQVQEIVATKGYQTPIYSPLIMDGHQYGQLVFYFREDEEQAWTAARATNTLKAYTDFHDQYPRSKYSDLALDKLEELEEKEEWHKVPKNRQAALLRYIQQNSQSPYVPDARRLVDELRNVAASPLIEEKREEPQPVVVAAGPPPIIESKLMVPERMVLVKGGTFQMGDAKGKSDEKPVHPVTLSDLLIAKYLLTFDEYDAFCNATSRQLPDDKGWGRGKRPVINVSWFDAINYCNWRSLQESLQTVYKIRGNHITASWQANGYRLPTEAEWEHAARGGQHSQCFEYAGSNNVDEVAWYDDNSGGKTHPVGEKKANELGLYDLSGNVLEWCWDWYGGFQSSMQVDPTGPATGSDRVVRGGAYCVDDVVTQSKNRNDREPGHIFDDLGFRLARTATTN